MELMSGVKDSLQEEVAGCMKELRQEHRSNGGNPSVWVADQGIQSVPRYNMLDLPMESSSKCLSQEHAEVRANHKEWYAVAKGRDGGSGVFDRYEEATVLGLAHFGHYLEVVQDVL
jgi:hypothetical protein